MKKSLSFLLVIMFVFFIFSGCNGSVSSAITSSVFESVSPESSENVSSTASILTSSELVSSIASEAVSKTESKKSVSSKAESQKVEASSSQTNTSLAVSSTTKTKTANDYITELKNAGLPIGTVVVYTTSNDPNSLMGRPNQYTSKVNFADTDLSQTSESDPVGGSIEVFNNETDAKARKNYIDSIGKSVPLFAEYSYLNGNVLLRLDKGVTPDQAAKFETEFLKIK